MEVCAGASGKPFTSLETFLASVAEVATQRVSNTFSGYCTSCSTGRHCLSYCAPLELAVQCDPWLIQRAQRSLDSTHRGLGQFYSSTTVTVVAPWPSVFLE